MMVKSSIENSRHLHKPFPDASNFKWFSLLILFPLAIYSLYLANEQRLLSFIMSLFPREADKSIGFYRDFLKLVFGEMLWITGFFILAWIIVAYVPLKMSTSDHKSMSKRALPFMIIAISFLASLFVAFKTLETFANSSDEYAYLFQAKAMGEGRLVEQGYSSPEFFYFNHIAQKGDIRVGRFPPGWPLILSIAYVAGISPALVNPILGLLTLLIFYQFARRYYTYQVSILSLAILALSSFFIFNSASYFSHVSCALFSIGFVFALYRYLDNLRIGYALLCGLMLGMIAITRYYTAALMFMPFVLFLFYKFKLKAIPVFIWIGLGTLPCIAFLFWYNYKITGNALVPVTIWAYDDEALGFVRGHTIIKGMEHIVRWTALLMYWSSPAMLILYIAALLKKVRTHAGRTSNPEDYFYLILMVGYFFYYQIGGNQYGPRFFFEAFPFLVLMVVNFAVQSRNKWAMAFLLSGICFSVVKFPFINLREHRVIRERNDLYDIVNAQQISNAVIFVSSHTGVIRPMPIGDLTRNDLHENGSVIYVQDRGAKNSIIINKFRGRKFYLYDRDPEKVHGELKSLKEL
jgi:hypothetical protein